MNVEFDLILNIRLEWIVGIDEIRFWEKRIDNQLSVIDDLMTPRGGVPKGGDKGPRGYRVNYIITIMVWTLCDSCRKTEMIYKNRTYLTWHQKNMIFAYQLLL